MYIKPEVPTTKCLKYGHLKLKTWSLYFGLICSRGYMYLLAMPKWEPPGSLVLNKGQF